MKTFLRPRRLFGISLLSLFFIAALTVAHAQDPSQVAAAHSPAQLTLSGDVQKPLSLSLSDLSGLPRTTIRVKNEHADRDEIYEGTSLATLLKQAGASQGMQLRGKAMATYVLAEGADGYRVIFSLAELDSDFQNSEVIVADALDGKPLDDKLGPLRLVRRMTSGRPVGCECCDPFKS